MYGPCCLWLKSTVILMNLHDNSPSALMTSISISNCSVTSSRFLDFSTEGRKLLFSLLCFLSPDYFRRKVIERRKFLTATKIEHWKLKAHLFARQFLISKHSMIRSNKSLLKILIQKAYKWSFLVSRYTFYHGKWIFLDGHQQFWNGDQIVSGTLSTVGMYSY